MGTGHALMAAESQAADRFMVLNGDVLPDVGSLQNMAAGGMAVSAIEVDDPTRYGVFIQEEGIFRSVVEKSDKPPSNLANAGIYLFKRSIFDDLRTLPKSVRGEYELTDALNLAAAREEIRIVELKSWLEIGRPWDILAANAVLLPEVLPEILGKVEPGATSARQGIHRPGDHCPIRSLYRRPGSDWRKLRYRAQLLHPAHDVHWQQRPGGKCCGGKEQRHHERHQNRPSLLSLATAS